MNGYLDSIHIDNYFIDTLFIVILFDDLEDFWALYGYAGAPDDLLSFDISVIASLGLAVKSCSRSSP